jgi:hypothetical protein
MIRTMSNAAAWIVGALVLGSAGCHENPNTGLPEPGIRTPWRTYAECPRPIEIIDKEDTPVPHRVLSKVFVTCTHYVPNECEDALKSRACDAGGDAVLVSEADENSAPYAAHPVAGSERNVRRGRHGVIIAWEK